MDEEQLDPGTYDASVMDSEYTVMIVDTARPKLWALLGSAFALVLVISLAIGASSPDIFVSRQDWAFTCPETGCTQTVTHNDTFVQQLHGLSDLNQFFMFSFAMQQKTPLEHRENNDFAVTVSMEERKEGQHSFSPVVSDSEHHFPLYCTSDTSMCQGVILIIELFLEAVDYDLYLSFPDSVGDLDWIGNIEFTFTFISSTFSKISIGARIVYTLVTFTVCVMFLRRMNGLQPKQVGMWTFEQKAAGCMLVAMLLYNLPVLFPLEAQHGRSWFTNLITAVCEVQFEVAILLLLTLSFDRMRVNGSPFSSRLFFVNVFVSTMVGMLLLIAAVAINTELKRDPVAAFEARHSWQDFIVAVSVLWVLALFYVMAIIIYAGWVIRGNLVWSMRYVFLGAIAVMYLASIAIGTLTNNFPLPHDTVAYLVYMAVRHLFVFALVLAYWPINDDGSIGFAGISFFANVDPGNTGEAASLLTARPANAAAAPVAYAPAAEPALPPAGATVSLTTVSESHTQSHATGGTDAVSVAAATAQLVGGAGQQDTGYGDDFDDASEYSSDDPVN